MLVLLQLYGFAYGGPFAHFLHKFMDIIFKGKKDQKTVVKKVNNLHEFIVFLIIEPVIENPVTFQFELSIFLVTVWSKCLKSSVDE